jgi:hypothetical protein
MRRNFGIIYELLDGYDRGILKATYQASLLRRMV